MDSPPISPEPEEPEVAPELPEDSEITDELIPPEAPDAPEVLEHPEVPEHPAPPEPPRAPAVTMPERMSASAERTWAMLAHLSILLNLVTGFLGPVVALIIYLAFKDRSRYIAYQAMQAFVFQLVWFFGVGILAVFAWIVSLALVIVIVGLCLIPLAILISLVPVAALVYGAVAAIQTSQGDDFRYWMVGDWVLPQEGTPGPVY